MNYLVYISLPIIIIVLVFLTNKIFSTETTSSNKTLTLNIILELVIYIILGFFVTYYYLKQLVSSELGLTNINRVSAGVTIILLIYWSYTNITALDNFIKKEEKIIENEIDELLGINKTTCVAPYLDMGKDFSKYTAETRVDDNSIIDYNFYNLYPPYTFNNTQLSQPVFVENISNHATNIVNINDYKLDGSTKLIPDKIKCLIK